MPAVAIKPRHRVRKILGRPLEFFLSIPKEMRVRHIDDLLGGLNSHETLHPDTPENIPVGEKQPVNLAQALAAEPKIILMRQGYFIPGHDRRQSNN